MSRASCRDVLILRNADATVMSAGADSQFMTQAPRREARGLDDMDSGRIPEEALFDDESLKAKPSVPRIYYATRTHSQIAQV